MSSSVACVSQVLRGGEKEGGRKKKMKKKKKWSEDFQGSGFQL